MGDPVSGAVAFQVTKLAASLIQSLRELRAVQKMNKTIVSEIDDFVSSVNNNINLLRKQLPNKNSSMALEKLQTDLDKAREELEEGLRNGNFKKFWTSQQVKEKLERLRREIINQIQVTNIIATLEVTINSEQKMDDFESRMLELSAMSAAQNHAATAEIRQLLQPLVKGMRQDPERLQSFISTVRRNEVEVETSSEIQKFLADVLSNLEGPIEEAGLYVARPAQPEDERDEYLDLFTQELMVDPVKCADGQTYDRFSVFKYNATQRKPLLIVVDDINMRRKIFEKFAEEGVESKFRNARTSYREQAFVLANNGHSAEAVKMLQNVLQWAPDDSECLTMNDRLEREIAEQRPLPVDQKSVPPAFGRTLDPPQPAKLQGYGPYQSGENWQSQYGPPQEGPRTFMSFADSIMQQSQQPENMQGLAVSIIILVLCFPCSLCCITCLFPEYCSKKKS